MHTDTKSAPLAEREQAEKIFQVALQHHHNTDDIDLSLSKEKRNAFYQYAAAPCHKKFKNKIYQGMLIGGLIGAGVLGLIVAIYHINLILMEPHTLSLYLNPITVALYAILAGILSGGIAGGLLGWSTLVTYDQNMQSMTGIYLGVHYRVDQNTLDLDWRSQHPDLKND